MNQQIENSIDLSNLTSTFASDAEIEAFFDQKSLDLKDKDSWIEKNLEFIIKGKDEISKAVSDGLIADGKPETIWKYKIKQAKEGRDKAIRTRDSIRGNVEIIKEEVAKRLSHYLPSWVAGKSMVNFTITDKADYCVDGNIITVDLGRLSSQKNILEDATKGITYEVFHLWMDEGSNWSDSNQDEASDSELRDRIIFKTIDEGIAVLVSGFSLEKHHADLGRNYTRLIPESFESFNTFLKAKDRGQLEKFKDEEFDSMGHFYVVGNEIAKTVLEHKGIEEFRKLIEESRVNPIRMIEEYNQICVRNPELPKIVL